jgi:putative Ca2+/H+ antiporter (TMEM165/GDT1 family)
MARTASRPGQTFDHTASGWAGVAVWSAVRPLELQWKHFFVSTGVVALGEMGDKTQLLAMLLAARFRKPAPIILGILVATLANHALAGALGELVAKAMGPDLLRWVIGLSFLAMAGWMLVPDEIDSARPAITSAWACSAPLVVAFFLAEMGDKTQIATVALAARFHDLVAVVAWARRWA